MDISISVPNSVAEQLAAEWQDISQHALEALAGEAYRTGILTASEVQNMLNLPSRWAVDEFFKQHHIYENYTESDLKQDINAIRQLSSK